MLRFFSLLILSLYSYVATANISGTIFKDYNLNGFQDTSEPGIEGITVEAYDDAGAVVTFVTLAGGTFNLATPTGNFRIEVANVPSYLKSTANTGSGMANVKPLTFNSADGASGLQIGLNNPAEFVDVGADIGMTFQINSDGTAGNFTTRILRNANIPADGAYDNNGALNAQPVNGDIATITSDTGSVWGIAYDRENNNIYVSAFIRRHAALGSMGSGGIYKIDGNTLAVSPFATVAGTGTVTANALRNLQSNPTLPGHDPVFDEIGRVGLGDLDISDDGTKLYTINTAANTFVEITIASPATQVATAIGNPFGAGCPNGDVKSWGIGQHDGKVYVGSVCTTNVTQGAYISELNGASFVPFHQIPLDFQGENSADGTPINKLPADARWRTWITNPTNIFNPVGYPNTMRISYPAPILSDIVFDENDGIIVGFIDRSAMQSGHDNFSPVLTDPNVYRYDASGDIYRVCKVAGNYFNEGHVNCPQTASTVVAPHYTAFPEYFGGEEWNPQHGENALGGLAYQQGTDRILSTAFDPVDPLIGGDHLNHSNSGIEWLNTVDGLRTSGIRMASNKTGAERLVNFAKAGGIGDVEYLNAPAPIEIGNFVWDDSDNDGIQDPSESAIANVVVKLYKAGVEVGSTSTNVDGQYYFGGLLDTNMLGGNTLEYGMNYELRIDLSDPALSGRIPTVKDAGASDNRDSDGDNGVLNATFSTVAFTTGGLGENDHKYDFGFVAFSLGNYVWYDSDQDGIQGASETGVNGVTATLFSDANCTAGNEVGMPVVTANGGMPAADGFYEFTGLATGTYCVSFSNIPAGYSISPTGAGTAATDSDAVITADPTVAQITNIALTADDPDEDMGIFVLGSVSGLVWCESGTNANTTYDVGDADTLQSHVQVTIYEDFNCNDTLDGAEAGTAVTQDTVAGLYSFTNLFTGGPGAGSNPPGCYIVEVDSVDPDLGLCSFDITATSLTPDIDAVVPNSINNNFGFEEHLILGDYVWYDNNQNGIQDVGEPGVNGVTVELFTNASCTAPSSQMTTTANGGMPAADGWYEFTPLPSGDYCIQFTGLVAGWVITSQNQGVDDAVDSDVDIATGQIQNISLSANDLTNDMGVFAPIGNIPGQVYCDVNLNLTYDSGEEQSGIAVTLLRDSDCDGTGDITLTTLDTDGTGSFDFINLPVGLSPIPPNPAACYVLNYDLVDTDLTGCSQPFLPVTSVVELSTDIPSAPAVEFGNHVGPPMKIPVNKWWALLALSLMIFMVGRRYKQS